MALNPLTLNAMFKAYEMISGLSQGPSEMGVLKLIQDLISNPRSMANLSPMEAHQLSQTISRFAKDGDIDPNDRQFIEALATGAVKGGADAWGFQDAMNELSRNPQLRELFEQFQNERQEYESMLQGAQRYGVSEPHKLLTDAALNLRTGARYLRDLADMFGSRLELVLAAYNAGEGAVRQYQNRIPPFRETQAYVKSVLEVYENSRRAATSHCAALGSCVFQPKTDAIQK